MKKTCIVLFLFLSLSLYSQEKNFVWKIAADQSINWDVEGSQSHSDHIEMSGLNISAIITYGVDENGELINQKKLVFPMLRTIPNNTHASLSQNFNGEEQPEIRVNGTTLKEFLLD
ncbi:hypothetical protein GM418_10655 [Maribellus comscasis]|uniref:Uncharacterized protein n=1 Tax=Maribellus comscasis TaxID=2681766 RepID=A0A6I6JSM1_9BACT|nr:hypothetical protein [Maribellus comscasis]QGY44100.1 hypothetical protein GM418_10655 [Maribellus comscasis]